MDEETSVADDLRASLAELTTNDTQGDEQRQETTAAPAPEGRDASGRFSPKTPAAAEQVPANQQSAKEEVAPLAGTTLPAAQSPRAPASWKPEEREGWEALAPKHQAAIHRREQEVMQVLQNTSHTRRFANEVMQVLQPHLGMIQAEGGTPVQTIQSMMQTASVLRNGTPQQKAQGIAGLIVQFGVPVDVLDGALEAAIKTRGAAPDPNMSAIQQLLDQRLAPVTSFINNLQQNQTTQVSQETATELDTFMNDPANEFASDVALDMADLLDLAHKRGQQMNLQDAYRRATMANPTISDLVASRKIGKVATQRNAAATRALNAAVSVSSTGAPGSDSEIVDDGSIRSALMASVAEHSARR